MRDIASINQFIQEYLLTITFFLFSNMLSLLHRQKNQYWNICMETRKTGRNRNTAH